MSERVSLLRNWEIPSSDWAVLKEDFSYVPWSLQVIAKTLKYPIRDILSRYNS
jgi:hypothetical protein